MGNEVRIFGVQLPMELNHNHLLGGLFISSPFVFFSSPYPLSPYHHSPCPKPLSSSMLLYPFSFTPSVYTSQIRPCSLTRPPITVFPFSFSLSLILSNINSINLFHPRYTTISSHLSLKRNLFTNHLTLKETHRLLHNAIARNEMANNHCSTLKYQMLKDKLLHNSV